jgi:hypothetical protein
MKKFAFLVATVLVFAAPVSAQRLAGTWRGGPDENTTMIFSFTEEGTGSWSVQSTGDGKDFSDTFQFNVVVNYETDPYQLDIKDLDHGFLVDKTMYGIFRLEGDDVLFLDFEPGDPGVDPTTVRPAEFTPDTVRLERVVVDRDGR